MSAAPISGNMFRDASYSDPTGLIRSLHTKIDETRAQLEAEAQGLVISLKTKFEEKGRKKIDEIITQSKDAMNQQSGNLEYKAKRCYTDVTRIACCGAITGVVGAKIISVAKATTSTAGFMIGGFSSVFSTLVSRVITPKIGHSPITSILPTTILGALIGGLQGKAIEWVAPESTNSGVYLGIFCGAVSSFTDTLLLELEFLGDTLFGFEN